jgi:hypothetical protein
MGLSYAATQILRVARTSSGHAEPPSPSITCERRRAKRNGLQSDGLRMSPFMRTTTSDQLSVACALVGPPGLEPGTRWDEKVDLRRGVSA